jgi:hypothetical protein
MPKLLVYAYMNIRGHQNTRVYIMTIEEYIDSWDYLKDKLLEAMLTLNLDYPETYDTVITIEPALGGKEIVAGETNASRLPQQTNPLLFEKGSYRGKSVHYRRRSYFVGRVIYNHLTKTIKVKYPQFSGSNWFKLREEYKIEHGKGFEVPPIIPPAQQFLRGNLEAILAQPADMTPLGYEEPPQSTYNENTQYNEPRSPYAETLEMPYEDKGVRTFLEDKFRKEQP